jgi:hypothetical protein
MCASAVAVCYLMAYAPGCDQLGASPFNLPASSTINRNVRDHRLAFAFAISWNGGARHRYTSPREFREPITFQSGENPTALNIEPSPASATS